MQLVKFVTKDKNNKFTCWCTTNDEKTFRDFMQYVLDNCIRPEEYILYDVDNNAAYNMLKVATETFKMRKRSFTERMKDIPTGKWIGGVV